MEATVPDLDQAMRLSRRVSRWGGGFGGEEEEHALAAAVSAEAVDSPAELGGWGRHGQVDAHVLAEEVVDVGHDAGQLVRKEVHPVRRGLVLSRQRHGAGVIRGGRETNGEDM